jgi:ankyrin repeat protein
MKRRNNNELAIPSNIIKRQRITHNRPPKKNQSIKEDEYSYFSNLFKEIKLIVIALSIPSVRNNLAQTCIELNALAKKSNHAEIFTHDKIILGSNDRAFFMRDYAYKPDKIGLPIIKNLLNSGIDPNPKDKMLKISPYEIARVKGNEEITSLLRPKKNISRNISSTNIELLMALYTGNVNELDKHIKAGAQLKNVSNYTWQKHPAICVAAHFGHTSIVEYIVKKHSDRIYSISRTEQTALHCAAQQGHAAVLEILLPHFGEHIQTNLLVNTYLTDIYGWNPLHYAAYNGHEQATALLIKHIINSSTSHLVVPHYFAARQGHTHIVKLLLKECPKYPIDITNACGLTQLHEAAIGGHPDTISFLLKNNANIEAQDYQGGTPLLKAVINRNYHTIRLLIEKGANINHCDGQEQNCLHLITKAKSKPASLRIAQHLIENGVNINQQDILGNTPLHYAAAKNYIKMVNLLLKYSANTSITNNRKKTASDIAEQKKFQVMTQLLREASNKKKKSLKNKKSKK